MPNDQNQQPTPDPAASSEARDLRRQLTLKSEENLFLKQRLEFIEQFRQHEQNCGTQLTEHKKEVRREIDKRIVEAGVVALVVAGIAWYQAVIPIRQKVSERLDKEFASDNIRALISQAAQKAAQSQTKTLMEATIKPATAEALTDIQQHRDEVSRLSKQVHAEMSQQSGAEKLALVNMHNEYTKDLSQVRALLDYQEKLKDIQLLKDEVISGDAASLDKLVSYSSSDKTLMDTVAAAVIEAKEPYAVGNRVGNISIWLNNSDGSHGLTNEKIPAISLIKVFLFNQSDRWEWRTRAAQLLGLHREGEVPDALLTAMNNDPNLWVRRAALVSFQSVTGFQPTDVLGFNEATDWWSKNKQAYLNSLPKK